MIRKKSRFWTFLFSFIPGAGEMYMGFMKQGISIMVVFMAIMYIYSNFGYGLICFLPIIWAYSFFHVHNLRGLPDEEFYALEDNYLFNFSEIFPKDDKGKLQLRRIVAVFLIIFGFAELWNNIASTIRVVIPDYMINYYNSFVDKIPSIVISLFMIWIGIKLIKGKKKELYSDESAKCEGR